MSFQKKIEARLPESLHGLMELAYNYWWTWDATAQRVFPKLDPKWWELSGNNAVLFLSIVPEESLQKASNDPGYLALLNQALQNYKNYMKSKNEAEPSETNKIKIGYLCAEFGIHRSLPIYSGGLGVLAGDHLKEASDLKLNFVAVGLLYSEGYFVQRLSTTGDQVEVYEPFDPVKSPLFILRDKNGDPVTLKIPMGMHEVLARVWYVNVGVNKLYLLDTNIAENTPEDREITSRLYQGGRVMRIRQEVLLGIGGMKLFEKLGEELDVIHLNEGHTAFAPLETMRKHMQNGSSFKEALDKTREKFVFTTHTPVPAGHDVFSDTLVIETLGTYAASFGMTKDDLLKLGRSPTSPGKVFNMTALAMQFSRAVNGVSKLNAEVMNQMWKQYFDQADLRVKGILPITNGVHMPTWIDFRMKNLYSKYLPKNWIEKIDINQTWEAIDKIPDEELWQTHLLIKERLAWFIRARIRKWVKDGDLDTSLVYASGVMLDPEVLTIGFARRFASYKRAPLIFSDPERLRKILTDPHRPVQLVFAGKAHPDDEYGKAFLRKIIQFAQDPSFQGRIAFIQDYEMEVAKYLISGVDVWLNNPRIPREASGTSGEKAAANGIINLSTADGWWREAYNGKNGWVIGSSELNIVDEERDRIDAESLYELLENKVVKAYYDTQHNGYNPDWTRMMKESIKTVIPYFNTRRMLRQYLQEMYMNH